MGSLTWIVLGVGRGCQLSVYCLSTPKGPTCATGSSPWPAGPRQRFASWGSRRDTIGGRGFSYSFCCVPLPTGCCGAKTGMQGTGMGQGKLSCRSLSAASASWPAFHMSTSLEFFRAQPPAPQGDTQEFSGCPHSFLISWAASSHSLLPLQQLLWESNQLPREFNCSQHPPTSQWISLTSLGSSPPTSLRSLAMD